MTYKNECERCGRALVGPEAAFVCSFDCTFCPDCSRSLDWRCPNCSGELNRRPRRNSGKARSRSANPRPERGSIPIRVSRASSDDLDVAARLFDDYRQFYHQPSDLVASRQFLDERFRLNDSVILLAWRNRKAVGFAQLYPHFSSTRLGRLWNLNDMFVAPRARRHGVASHLLRRCQELARETGSLGVWLETAVDNPAQRLYAAHGWKLDREFLHFDWAPAEEPPSAGPATRKRRAHEVRTRRVRRS